MAIYLVTGACSGIGEALARQLCAAGHTVYGVARRGDKLAELAGANSGRFFAFPGDVTDKDAVSRLCAALPQLPDVLILNAGVGEMDAKAGFDLALHERTFAVNYFGVMHFIDALLPRMQERGAGKIAAVASLAAYRGLPRAAAYGASKAALSVAIESFRVTNIAHGVEFLTIHPGFVKTPMAGNSTDPRPFEWPVDKAARFILASIEKGDENISFPWSLRLGIGLLWLFPAGLYRRLVRKSQN